MAATAAARWLQVDVEPIRRALVNFKALEHRLEKCGEPRGIAFYNDSDSTTPESTVAALKSFDGPVTLIAGGYDKKLDLRPLAQMAAQRAKVLITIGQTGPMIAQWCGEAALQAGKTPVIREAGSLEEAVQAALELSMPGSAVVFSPGCASYDMFQNFADRGRHFKKLVAAAT
jgi:UDP-N-acetylmuramoylalanine--D-glutamate ligase